jgi:hypothetical protein
VKIKRIVEAELNTADLLEFDSVRIWMSQIDYYECDGWLDAFRQSYLRTKVNIWLAQQDRSLEGEFACSMKFYFGVFGRKLVVKKK